MAELDIDSASLRIVLEMQLEDLKAIVGTRKGKQRQGEVDDFEFALNSYRSDVEAQLLFLRDRIMCQSMATAVRHDADIVNEFMAQEEQASRDRDLALRSTNGVVPSDQTPKPALTKADSDEKLLNKLEALYVSPPNGDDDSSCQAESSWWGATRQPNFTPYRSCTACTEEYPAHNLGCCSQCSHEYCRGCLRKLFSDSLTDESLFPPRCCGNVIEVETVRGLLPPKLLGEFQAKKLELETPNRTYCHQPTCSTFIPPAAISGDMGRCVRCRQTTCTICKGPSHSGFDCPEDTGIQTLLDVAAENGWQRCYQCHRIVELNYGCYHITCICKAQFCYLCGRRWKECACKQWDNDRLLTRAQDIVARGVGARRLDPVQREALVGRERQNLLENHECTHGKWSYRSGGHRCEECHHMLPQYIYECRQCHVMVCRRCRYNRL